MWKRCFALAVLLFAWPSEARTAWLDRAEAAEIISFRQLKISKRASNSLITKWPTFRQTVLLAEESTNFLGLPHFLQTYPQPGIWLKFRVTGVTRIHMIGHQNERTFWKRIQDALLQQSLRSSLAGRAPLSFCIASYKFLQESPTERSVSLWGFGSCPWLEVQRQWCCKKIASSFDQKFCTFIVVSVQKHRFNSWQKIDTAIDKSLDVSCSQLLLACWPSPRLFGCAPATGKPKDPPLIVALHANPPDIHMSGEPLPHSLPMLFGSAECPLRVSWAGWGQTRVVSEVTLRLSWWTEQQLHKLPWRWNQSAAARPNLLHAKFLPSLLHHQYRALVWWCSLRSPASPPAGLVQRVLSSPQVHLQSPAVTGVGSSETAMGFNPRIASPFHMMSINCSVRAILLREHSTRGWYLH